MRAHRTRLPTSYPVSWDFEALELCKRELDDEVDFWSGMHDQVICWNDEVTVSEGEVMYEGGASSTVDMRANEASNASVDASTDSSTSVNAGDITGTVAPDVCAGPSCAPIVKGSGVGVG